MTVPTATSFVNPLPFDDMAKDGEVALSSQPVLGVSRSFFWGFMDAEWPIP
jgi:hypothetical protein